METAGAIKIFESSVKSHSLYYTSFYGDGDSKAYPAVKDIYGPSKPVRKFECTGHYQKKNWWQNEKIEKSYKRSWWERTFD